MFADDPAKVGEIEVRAGLLENDLIGSVLDGVGSDEGSWVPADGLPAQATPGGEGPATGCAGPLVIVDANDPVGDGDADVIG